VSWAVQKAVSLSEGILKESLISPGEGGSALGWYLNLAQKKVRSLLSMPNELYGTNPHDKQM
jgi:hypothetical protein